MSLEENTTRLPIDWFHVMVNHTNDTDVNQ